MTPSPVEDGISRMGRGMTVAFWLLVLLGGTIVFTGVTDRRENPNGRPEGTLQGGTA
jgi:hypothetical protein